MVKKNISLIRNFNIYLDYMFWLLEKNYNIVTIFTFYLRYKLNFGLGAVPLKLFTIILIKIQFFRKISLLFSRGIIVFC